MDRDDGGSKSPRGIGDYKRVYTFYNPETPG